MTQAELDALERTRTRLKAQRWFERKRKAADHDHPVRLARGLMILGLGAGMGWLGWNPAAVVVGLGAATVVAWLLSRFLDYAWKPHDPSARL